MSFLGRYPKGGVVPITFITVNGSDVPTEPDAAPCLEIYQGATILTQMKVAALDQLRNTGLFQYLLLMDANFTTGSYRAQANWIISSTSYAEVQTWDVVTAGDAEGQVIAMDVLNQPKATYALLVGQGGRTIKRRNPRAL